MKLRNDFLYIGDGSDNTVKTFDAKTGRFLGSFVASNCNCLFGPRGLIFDHRGNLLVTNQNVGQPQNGDVLKFNGQTGSFLGELVHSADPNSPFAPRGIVLSKHNVLYVADIGDVEGEVRMYNGTTGTFIGKLDHSGFSPFHPRGLVFGPDGLLYVSAFDFLDGKKGWVLRFDTKTNKFLDVFISDDDIKDLHRPEGLVFGPDGNLYITSFRKDVNDTDKILIVNRRTRKLLDKIDLYTVGQPRAFAQALLFGPDGKLFVPITGPGPITGEPLGPDTGSVRRYNVHHHLKTFDEFVLPALVGGPLGEPWYLTFGKTNPATLAYGCDHDDNDDDCESEED
ncbi:Vgb family protein [Gottfriedia acidiceleris]|uniref:Vgb family protein n=1 Tax=Gottfriedia acidiceleris TaxID=371036 RepID=UPI003000AF58